MALGHTLPEPSERLRLREAAGITQDELAAQIGVDRNTIRRWESGTDPRIGDKRRKYAQVLEEWSKLEENHD
jgi:transcriptional regulator with XRE-family HTH domain